jgi:hypothetical protein
MAMGLNSAVFSSVTPYILVYMYQSYNGAFYIQHQVK